MPRMMTEDEINKKFAESEKEFKVLCSNPTERKIAVENFVDAMIDELTLELIFETHRSFKIGTLEDEESYNDEENIVSSTTEGVGDIVRQQIKNKSAQDCTCPICNRTVVASRFAPHLETCMGMGRKRSRNASRMVNNNNNKERETSYGGMASDDEDDADWNSGDKRKKKKTNNSRIKKTKNSPKKNGDSAVIEISSLSYDNMSEEEKKNILTKFCGVVSEHTKKICSRSLRCNLHSDEKRKALRTAVICDNEGSEIVNVDVEGDDDMDTSSLRDLLQDNSNTSSPADSASNSNSSSSLSSKKREKTGKFKNKNSKKDRSSPCVNASVD